jgi:hypothetical protein
MILLGELERRLRRMNLMQQMQPIKKHSLDIEQVFKNYQLSDKADNNQWQ